MSDAQLSLVYVGGVGRSGSTLLESLLVATGGVVGVGELVHLWERGVLANDLCGCGARFLECPFWSAVGKEAFGGWDRLEATGVLALKRQVDRNRYLPYLASDRMPPEYRDALTRYRGLLNTLLLAVRSVAGECAIVDSSKHPSTAWLLSGMSRLDFRLVRLVRDPRAVAYSYSKRIVRPETVGANQEMERLSPVRAGCRWSSHNLALDRLATRVGSTLVTYEALCAEPLEELARVRKGVGLSSPTETLLNGARHSEQYHSVSGNPMRFRSRQAPLHPDLEWRSALRLRDRAVVSAIAAPVLAFGHLRVGERRA